MLRKGSAEGYGPSIIGAMTMSENHVDHAKANTDLTPAAHTERLARLTAHREHEWRRRVTAFRTMATALAREEQAARIRAKVREICELFLDPAHVEDLPLKEVLEAGLNWMAGMLEGQDLDEPAGAKVRRLGRRMSTEDIVF